MSISCRNLISTLFKVNESYSLTIISPMFKANLIFIFVFSCNKRSYTAIDSIFNINVADTPELYQ